MPKTQKERIRPSPLSGGDRTARAAASAFDEDIDLDDLLARASQALKERQEAVMYVTSRL